MVVVWCVVIVVLTTCHLCPLDDDLLISISVSIFWNQPLQLSSLRRGT